MLAWDAPQNSAHWPWYSPGASAVRTMRLTLPGIASRLPPSGGHPEAVDDVGGRRSRGSTGRPAGRWRSRGRDDAELRVLELPPPLVADDLHPEGVRRRRRPGSGRSPRTVGKAMNVRMTAGAIVQAISSRRARAPGGESRRGRAPGTAQMAGPGGGPDHEEDGRVPPEDLEEDPVRGPAEIGSGRQRGRRRVQQAAAGQQDGDGQGPESRDPGQPRAPESRFRFHMDAIGGARSVSAGNQPSANAGGLPARVRLSAWGSSRRVPIAVSEIGRRRDGSWRIGTAASPALRCGSGPSR